MNLNTIGCNLPGPRLATRPFRTSRLSACVIQFSLATLLLAANGRAQSSGTPPPAVPNAPAQDMAPAPQASTPAPLPSGISDPVSPQAGADGKPETSPTIPATNMGTLSQKAPGVDSATYIIGPEDVLQVTVWKEPTLSGSIPVRPDGKISMVLLNDVTAAGLTPMQLSGRISERLKKYIQDPIVSVLVTAVNSRKVFLVGEVARVGPLSLAYEMTPLQAIAAAGGLSTFANSKHIYILRADGAHQQKIPFNYKKALKGDSSQDIPLKPGDTIVVP